MSKRQNIGDISVYVAYVSFTVYVYKVQNDQGISNGLPTSDKNFGILLILDKELNLLNNLENDLFLFGIMK